MAYPKDFDLLAIPKKVAQFDTDVDALIMAGVLPKKALLKVLKGVSFEMLDVLVRNRSIYPKRYILKCDGVYTTIGAKIIEVVRVDKMIEKH